MRRFVANTDRTGGFVLSPDGQRLLWSQTVGTDVGLAVRAVADTQAVRSYATGNQGRGGGYYNWLPDSRHVVFTKDERGDENTQLRVFDAQAPGHANEAVIRLQPPGQGVPPGQAWPPRVRAGVPARVVGEAGCSQPSVTMDQLINGEI
mgnify:CR=1 FL=1